MYLQNLNLNEQDFLGEADCYLSQVIFHDISCLLLFAFFTFFILEAYVFPFSSTIRSLWEAKEYRFFISISFCGLETSGYFFSLTLHLSLLFCSWWVFDLKIIFRILGYSVTPTIWFCLGLTQKLIWAA